MHYAVIQGGNGIIWGVGKTREEAIEEAENWVPDFEDGEIDLIREGEHFDMKAVPCTEGLYNKVNRCGGDISTDYTKVGGEYCLCTVEEYNEYGG